MSSARRAILPWLLLPLAFAAGWFVADDGVADRARARGRPTDPGHTDVSDGDGAPDAPRTAASQGKPRARAGSEVRDLEDFLRSRIASRGADPTATVPRTDKTITGRVTDADGNPVAGVLVRGEPDFPREVNRHFWSSDDEDAEPTTSPEAMALRDAVRAVSVGPWVYAARRETRTGPDGAYELRGLQQVEYDLDAYLNGYEVESQGSDSLMPGGVCDFSVSRLVEVQVTVLDAAGREAARAAVFATADSDDHPFEYDWISKFLDWRRDARTIRVPEGVVRFAARDGNLVSAVVAAKTPSAEPVVLRLAETATLTVRVPQGALGLHENVPLMVRVAAPDGPAVLAADVDGETRTATLAAVPAGRLRLQLAWSDDPDDPALVSVDLDVAPGANEVVVAPDRISPDAGFFLKGVRSDGAPVERESTGVDISFVGTDDVPAWSMHEGAEPGCWFVVRGPDRGDLRARITVTEQGASATVEIGWGDPGPVVVPLPRLYSTVVRGLRQRSGWDLRRRTDAGAEDPHFESERDDDGNLRLSGLAPGDYELSSWNVRSGGAMRFRVPCPSVLDWRPAPWRAYRVAAIDGDAVTEADVEAAAHDTPPSGLAALAEDDVLVAFDGVAPTDNASLAAARAAALVRTTVDVTVRRAGRTFRIRCDPAALFQDDDLISLAPHTGE